MTNSSLTKYKILADGTSTFLRLLIVTDTKETEQNYMIGLRDSIPKELQGKLVIKVCKVKTVELVSEALNMASLQPQYGEPWIVFDRDQVKDFDKIITTALENGIHVGWSNPCIEIWFSIKPCRRLKNPVAQGYGIFDYGVSRRQCIKSHGGKCKAGRGVPSRRRMVNSLNAARGRRIFL